MVRYGSSPLARGTHERTVKCLLLFRLIPARAGNTSAHDPKSTAPPAHPRSRGEHAVTFYMVIPWGGSSPLARGTRHEALALFGAVRLIPARAGNTLRLSWVRTMVSAHPRSRGEHRVTKTQVFGSSGSSPLARGTRCESLAQGDYRRLIPARAGNTLADMGFYPLHQQNRITLEPEPASRIHDKQ